MQVDGLPMVLDLEKSHGSYCHDALTDKDFLDFFALFGTLPVGYNHPRMVDPETVRYLGEVAVHNVTNSDFYTREMASFVETFSQRAIPKELPHLFMIAGGALGVENALKAAFDWKIRRNFKKGTRDERGTKVIHFEESFHGRTGYTL